MAEYRGRLRREPSFSPAESPPDLRLTGADRVHASPAAAQEAPKTAARKNRREPHFAPLIEAKRPAIKEGPSPDIRSDEEEAGMARVRDKASARETGGKEKGSEMRRRRRSLIGFFFKWSFVAALWAMIAFAGLFAYHAAQLPPIDQLKVPKRPPNIAILAADGSLLANRGETGGRTVQIGELPDYLPKAFIAIEDRRFYSHWGIDPVGIGRAIFRNMTGKGVTQGGSTLTQQLAKNLFLTQERTVSRKFQEAILALWLERNYSKNEILALYMNRVYFGAGAYGVEAAAQRYFGKSARAVTLAEAAMLAGLVQAPSRLAPNRNPEAAQARAELVLAAMTREGMIDDRTAKVALIAPAKATQRTDASSINYAADYVMDVIDDFIGTIESDIVVVTTLDRKLQIAAEKALGSALARDGAKFGVGQGAMVVLDPMGAVKALIGGRNYSESQFNRAVNAKRQPGSAFKPFVYLAALERGLTPETKRIDGPVTVRGWSPENYSRQFFGEVTLTTALAKSLNTVPVKLGIEMGPKAIVRVAHRLGISSPLKANASLPLGTSEISPLELTAAYAAFANGGIGVIPHVIVQVKTVDGKVIYRRKPSTLGRVIAASDVAAMNHMMRETLITGTGRKAELPGIDAAGKTGTSQDFRDAWFVGYTAHLVAGVWLGNDDNSPTKKVSGGNLPSEVWRSFMIAAHQTTPNLALPSGGPALPRPPGELTQPQPTAPLARNAPPPAPAAAADRPPRPPANVGAGGDNPWERPKEPGLLDRIFRGG